MEGKGSKVEASRGVRLRNLPGTEPPGDRRSRKIRDFYRGKKVLIPGGAGFIGARLGKRLFELGAGVTVVDSFHPACGGNLFNLQPYRRDIRVIRQGIETFVGKTSLEGISCIFNCVGLSDHHLGFLRPDIDYRINCQAGLALLKKLSGSRASAKIISIGSRSQYGRGGLNTLESSPLRPLDFQAVHKTALEHYHEIYANRFGIDFIFFRLTNTYGPGQKMRGRGIGFVGEMIRDSLDKKKVTVYGNLDRIKDLLYVDDVVEALLLSGMMKENSPRVFNLGGRPWRVGELIEGITKRVPEMKVQMDAFPEEIKEMDAGDAVLNSGRFSSATGWSPKTSLDEGISTTVDYYRAHKRRYW